MRHNGCSISVTANSSHLLSSGALPEVGGDETLVAIFLREIKHDRDRLREHQFAVDQGRDSSGRIDLEVFRAAMFAGEHVDGDGFNGTPNSCSVQRTRIERVGPNSNNFILFLRR